MSDLSDFLSARIAEDEEVALAAINPERPGTHWHWVMDGNDTPVRQGHLRGAQDSQPVSLRTVEESPTTVGPLPHFVTGSLDEVHPGGGEHIARHDPARVLAECAAKRRIVEAHGDQVRRSEQNAEEHAAASRRGDVERIPNLRSHGWQLDGRRAALDFTLRLLALPYADHDDYREEWKP